MAKPKKEKKMKKECYQCEIYEPCRWNKGEKWTGKVCSKYRLWESLEKQKIGGTMNVKPD